MGRTVTEDCWQRACCLSGVFDFVHRLENQFDTVVGEKGTYLSGGERQRVAIARALLTDPPILIMDEPSNNLDGESRTRIEQGLLLAKEGKTVVLVTHDPQLAKKAGRVYRMEKNKKETIQCR